MHTWRFRAGDEMAVHCGERNIFNAANRDDNSWNSYTASKISFVQEGQ